MIDSIKLNLEFQSALCQIAMLPMVPRVLEKCLNSLCRVLHELCNYAFSFDTFNQGSEIV